MRVLVVEDNPRMAAVLSRGLAEEGYAVDLAERGADAEPMAHATAYDAIILDVMLPDRDGVEVCRALRRRLRTPILMLTILSGTDDKVRGLDAGADDYLTKPFQFSELAARLRALLRRGREGESTTLECDDLVLDLLAREARRGGQVIRLTGKEFALLEYLMRNPGCVLTRTRIAEHVWDMNLSGASNVVAVYVHALREKVDRDFARQLIHTVVGRGYRFGPGQE